MQLLSIKKNLTTFDFLKVPINLIFLLLLLIFNVTLFQGVVDEDTSEDEDDPEFGPDDDNNDDVKVEEHEVADEGHVFQSVVFTSETEAILI